MPEEVCIARAENEDWRILSVECSDVECDCCSPECGDNSPTRSPTSDPPTAPPIVETSPPTKGPGETNPPTEAPDVPTPEPGETTPSPTNQAPTVIPDEPTPLPTPEEPETPAPTTPSPTAQAPTEAPKEPTAAPVPATPEPTTVAPVAVPTPFDRPTSDSREDQIFLQLTAITDPATLDNPETPQGRAYQWIANEDPRQLDPGDPTLDQRYILTTLYYATTGDEWTECFQGATNDECGKGLFPDANAFLSEESECTWGYWAGSSCNSEGAIRAVQIPNNNLVGTLPSEIASLPALDTLSLEQNGLAGSLLESWPRSLFRLRLSKNSFTGTASGGLPQTLSLLYIDENQLSGTIDDLIGSLQDVSQLHLQSNSFTGTIPESLGTLTSLRVARFEDNELTGTMPQQVCTNRDENPTFRSLVTGCPPEFDCACCSNRCAR